MPKFTDAQLYNGQLYNAEPNWGRFLQLELEPCHYFDDEAIEVCDVEEAEFWTVYGREHPNEHGHYLANAITDIPFTEDREAIVAELKRRSGLPLIRCAQEQENYDADLR